MTNLITRCCHTILSCHGLSHNRVMDQSITKRWCFENFNFHKVCVVDEHTGLPVQSFSIWKKMALSADSLAMTSKTDALILTRSFQLLVFDWADESSLIWGSRLLDRLRPSSCLIIQFFTRQVEHGGDITLPTEDKMTSLGVAVAKGTLNTAKYFFQVGKTLTQFTNI